MLDVSRRPRQFTMARSSPYHERSSQGSASTETAHVDFEDPMPTTRYPRVSPRSGLREEWHDHFEVPSVTQRSITSLKFNGQTTAVHRVPLENGLTLDFYARLCASDELVITFHGAYRKEKYEHPRFERVRSLKGAVPTHIALADPTVLPRSEQEDAAGLVSRRPWLGSDGRHSQGDSPGEGAVRAKHVLFIGGSGGGHAALRMSAHLPGSLTYVQAPATDIHRCFPTAKKNYFETVWPGWDPESLLDAFPERFNMPELYRRRSPENFVYYAQSTRDPHYLETHFEPFRAATPEKPTGPAEPRGRRWLSLYEGAKEGHGAMTPPEFREHLDLALTWWRARRTSHP